MSPTENPNPKTKPVLPPNVTIFAPPTPAAATALLTGGLFSRLTASAATAPSTLAKALAAHTEINSTFCYQHHNVVLVFDAATEEEQQQEGEDVTDAHHEHVRAVCLALRDADVGLDIAGCVFDAGEVLAAGFQCERLSGGDVMVVDVMGGGDDEEDEEDGLEALLKGGEAVA